MNSTKDILNFLRCYWPSLLVVLVILYATWIPKPLPDDTLPSMPNIDKLIHAIMFGGLAGALMFDYHRKDVREHKLSLTVLVVIGSACAAFGVLDEVVQGLLGFGRESDVWDLTADWVGIGVAMLVAPIVIRRIFRKKC